MKNFFGRKNFSLVGLGSKPILPLDCMVILYKNIKHPPATEMLCFILWLALYNTQFQHSYVATE